MQYGSRLNLLILWSALTLSGCVQHTIPPSLILESIGKIERQAFHTISTNECSTLQITEEMGPKINNFMIIFDPTASMTEPYTTIDCTSCHQQYQDTLHRESHTIEHGGLVATEQGANLTTQCRECHGDYAYSKFHFAKEITSCLNQTIPDLPLTASLKTFGFPVYSSNIYGPQPYAKNQYRLALKSIFEADGASPLPHALLSAKKDFFTSKGNIAVIIISDGEDMDETSVLAAESLKISLNNICIYTIHVGDDTLGNQLLARVADAGQCGNAVSAANLLNPQTRDAFIKEIFLTEKASAPRPTEVPIKTDSDNDDVPDKLDNCPGTPPELVVDANGCWRPVIPSDILFKFDQYTLLESGKKILDKIVATLQKHPFLQLKMNGHTDSIGSVQYNESLSMRRVEAGRDYIVAKGIAMNRIHISWHADSMPKASNKTVEGRALNRRIEFEFTRN